MTVNASRAAVLTLLVALTAPVSAQVIVKVNYRPPETVQRVAIPVNPTEPRLKRQPPPRPQRPARVHASGRRWPPASR